MTDNLHTVTVYDLLSSLNPDEWISIVACAMQTGGIESFDLTKSVQEAQFSDPSRKRIQVQRIDGGLKFFFDPNQPTLN